MNPLDRKVLQTISYKANVPYFGALSAKSLSHAYRQYRTTDSYGGVALFIGTIDGNVICDAIWREMSINPVRFGKTSPFLLNGRNNMFAFCDGRIGIKAGPASDVLAEIKKNMLRFMQLNSLPNGQWRCDIPTDGGYVHLFHGSHIYPMLARLRDCIKTVTKQNVKDFKNKKGPYYASIYQMVTFGELRPEPDDYMTENRRDNYLELLDSIIDAPSEYNENLYNQAIADKERFIHDSVNNNQR